MAFLWSAPAARVLVLVWAALVCGDFSFEDAGNVLGVQVPVASTDHLQETGGGKKVHVPQIPFHLTRAHKRTSKHGVGKLNH